MYHEFRDLAHLGPRGFHIGGGGGGGGGGWRPRAENLPPASRDDVNSALAQANDWLGYVSSGKQTVIKSR
jgi:hypothetical protein